MPASNTYESIVSTTLTNTVTELTFSSIPQTYTDLVLIVTAKGTGTDDLYIRCNSDTGSNYAYVYLTGNGTAASSGRGSVNSGLLTDYDGTPSTDNNHIAVIHFLNYSNTTTYKTMLSRSGRAASGTNLLMGLWSNTSAISSLILRLPSWSLASGTVASLYGIKAA